MPLDSWITRVEPAAPVRSAAGDAPPADAGWPEGAGALRADSMLHPPETGRPPLADMQPYELPPSPARGVSSAPRPETINDDPVSAAADAAFAELATRAALAEELRSVAPRPHLAPHSEEDWTPQLLQSGRALHALMGIDDPLLQTSSSYDEPIVEAELRDALRRLPTTSLADGELAALDAFDMALGAGADMEEALSAAIAAAEAAGGPDWAAPRREEFLSPTPRLEPAEALTSPDATFELAGAETEPAIARGASGRDAADPAFDVRIAAIAPADALVPGGLNALDPAFGVGFGFQPAEAPISLPLDFERRLAAADRDRTDTVTSVAAAATVSTDIAGSAGADFLVGGSGDHVIGGLEGDDYLYGDTPTDLDTSVHDAANPLTNPTFDTDGGADAISGGAGDDSIWGGAGDDRLHGDIPDTGTSLADEFGFDLGTAGFGDDALWGGAGADSLWGGGGNDSLYGEAGADSLIGGAGNDILDGGAGDDRLEGDAGMDTLYGQAGADNLFGYADDDVVIGGEGDDTLAGGTGADEFRFAGGSGADALAHATSLGTDTISDYSAADGDTFGFSDADFGFGSSGSLTDGDTYFEYVGGALSGSPLDASGGNAGPAIVAFGANSGTDGVSLYYTDDASAMTESNSYQIADVIGVNMTDVEAADFFFRS